MDPRRVIAWDSALSAIIAEGVRAEMKHGVENQTHTLVDWIKVVAKQVGDLAQALKHGDHAAVRKELSQVGAAAMLAITALDKEGG